MDSCVFCGGVSIPRANVTAWTKIGGYYSRDDRRLFYGNREMRSVDYNTFEVVPGQRGLFQLARDKTNFYVNDAIAEKARFLKMAANPTCFTNPFASMPPKTAWFTTTVVSLAQSIYDDRAFDRLPILADALEDAGCDSADILNHCRQPGEHVRGCWVVDLVLGKE